jgi:succinyl-diaminopimelate desuccinylase
MRATPAPLDLLSDVVTLTAALVDVESVSGNEKRIVDAIEGGLRELPHLTVEREGNNIVARTSLGLPERVVLAGHADTVPLKDNFPSRIEGDRMYGCGTSDMKSGLAVMLALAASVPTPTRDVTYVIYDCEEVEAERNGLRALAETRPELLRGDFAVLLESSLGEIEGGCQGTMRIEVTARGERAHTARAWMGENAIHGAGAILDILRSYEPEQPVVDGLRFHEGLNAVFVRGGVAGNVVPDECVVTINYRYAPDKSPAEAEAWLRELFEGFEVTVIDSAPGARPGLGHPAAASFVTAITGAPDVASAVEAGQARAKFGWTDVARFDALGIPAVNCGPGDASLAHTPGEYVEIPRIVALEKRMRAWLTDRS